MKVLVDECSPRLLKRELSGHSVQTAQECGWAGIKNGELLRLAEAQFEIFVTSDQNLRYQQNLAGRKIAIIELPTNRRASVRRLIPKILQAITTIRAGDYVRLETPEEVD